MITGRHFQNAYITRDIRKSLEMFKGRADVRKIIEYEGSNEVMTPSGPAVQTNKLAFIWVGDLQYELIEPVSGQVDIYRDAMPTDDSLQFHHVCARIDDWDSFRAQVDRQPYPVVIEGNSEALKFVYLDAREFLGHYLEYVWMTDERWGQMGGR